MTSLLIAAIFKVALPFLCIIALVDLLTMSRPRRVRMLRRQGHTWATIAARFNVSPSTVRRWSFA
jgi:DNA invertase Pin-like site-specific DNA recombinase